MASINIEPKVGSRKHTLSFLVFIELLCFFRGLLGGGGGGGEPLASFILYIACDVFRTRPSRSSNK